MAKSIWKAGVRTDANMKTLGPYNRLTRRICPKERQNLPLVKDQERGGPGICR